MYEVDEIQNQEIENQNENLNCNFSVNFWKGDGTICVIEDQKIETEGKIVDNELDERVNYFEIVETQKVEFLPESLAKSFPNLIEYKAMNCVIKNVSDKIFEDLYELLLLNLKGNEIAAIAIDAFKDLGKLEFLDLSDNQIRFIDPELFEPLSSLELLTLSQNKIELLSDETFESLRSLQEIFLKDNQLVKIAVNLFKNNQKLKWISLTNNKLKIIPSKVFERLTQLNTVHLQGNICVDRRYSRISNPYTEPFGFSQMKRELKMNCSRERK